MKATWARKKHTNLDSDQDKPRMNNRQLAKAVGKKKSHQYLFVSLE